SYDRRKDLGITGFKRLAWFSAAAGIAGGHTNISAGHEDPTVLPFEFYTIGIVSADVHGYSIRILCGNFKIPMHGPKTRGRELGISFQFDWSRVLRPHSPMSDINMMCSPAGDHACAKLLATKPSGTVVQVGLGVDPIQCVINVRSRTEPHVIVEVGRYWHLVSAPSSGVTREANVYAMKPTNSAVPYEFASPFELGPG